MHEASSIVPAVFIPPLRGAQVERGKERRVWFMSSKKADRVERGERIGYRMERVPRIDPALLEAFERELTPDVARRLLELAARRVAMLRAAGITVASDEAKLLVQEAFAETLSQTATWQPAQAPLAAHLSDIVRRRSWAKLAQARKLRAMAIELVTSSRSATAASLASIDTGDAGDAGDAGSKRAAEHVANRETDHETEQGADQQTDRGIELAIAPGLALAPPSSSEPPIAAPIAAATVSTIDPANAAAAAGSEPPAPLLPIWRHGALELAQRVIASLSEDSPQDAAVRLLLEAYCDGAATRVEVLAASGLALADYVHARRHLDRLLAALPEPELESAISAMWRGR